VRVPDLHAFREAIARLANPSSVIVVPTRSAGRLLGASIGDAITVNRDELYAQLHGRLAAPAAAC